MYIGNMALNIDETMNQMAYKVGPLLYMPATKENASRTVTEKSIRGLSAVAFCLEDAIADEMLEEAENRLIKTLEEIARSGCCGNSRPMLFVRVRNPKHLVTFGRKVQKHGCKVTGFIFPKFDTSNAESYIEVANALDDVWDSKPCFMPILESQPIASALTRHDELNQIKSLLDCCKNEVLNVRVGGNDLCSQFGLRRSCHQNIYQIGAVRDALIDILSVFGKDYVVSGPVWEYFGSDGDLWQKGLLAELELDKINGFIGKTAIHPCQVPVIARSLMVTKSDYDDARSILNWRSKEAVLKSQSGNRMDELKTHERWAYRTICLADAFGIIGE